MDRNYGVDRIRVILTFLVVFHHVAIVYGGAGGWYWIESPSMSNFILTSFVVVNQSFFMGFFFLLAGYYSASSIERKGSKFFLYDRLIRLGIPYVIFLFIIHPFTVALYTSSIDGTVFAKTVTLISMGEFRPGPLWFLGVLLFFSLCAVIFFEFQSKTLPSVSRVPGVSLIVLAFLLVGVLNILVRSKYAVGQTVWGMNFGHFPAYIFLFLCGFSFWRERLLEKISLKRAAPLFLMSLILVVTAPSIISALPLGDMRGGFNARAIFYGVWEPITGIGIIAGLLWLFLRVFNGPSIIWGFLAKHTYAIYVVHTTIVVFVSLLMKDIALPSLANFCLQECKAVFFVFWFRIFCSSYHE